MLVLGTRIHRSVACADVNVLNRVRIVDNFKMYSNSLNFSPMLKGFLDENVVCFFCRIYKVHTHTKVTTRSLRDYLEKHCCHLPKQCTFLCACDVIVLTTTNTRVAASETRASAKAK